MKSTPSSLALASPSSEDTWRLSGTTDMSVLFPTSIITTSFPRSARTSSIHFDTLVKEAVLGEKEVGGCKWVCCECVFVW